MEKRMKEIKQKNIVLKEEWKHYNEKEQKVAYNGGGHVPPSSKYETHNLDRANFHSTSARSYKRTQINV